jgi:Fibrobacter succinogenes major domain (Fib_succ_major).
VVLDNNKTFTNNLKKIDMEKAKTIITITGVFILLFSYGNMSGNIDHSGGSNSDQTSSKSIQTKTKSTQTGSKSVQTKTKSAQTGSKSTQTKSKSIQKSSKSEPDNKSKDIGTVRIGTQTWAVANLNVSTFRNGDSIPEARTNKEWVAAGESGKPAWCYYNNDPAIGLKYGKLYNWYAVNDPRELAPVGWTLSSDADYAKLISYLGGPAAAGSKMKSTSRWSDGNNGTNETGFTGFPGGYRVENGTFLNFGSIGIWWSSTESNARSGVDHYLAQSNSLVGSSSPKQRGESVRCLRN